MSRTFKFRIWDKDAKRLYRWPISVDFHLKKNGEPGEYCEILQYSGLKDKNGKEIYEGDVVDVEDSEGGRNLFTVKFNTVRRKMLSEGGFPFEADISCFHFEHVRTGKPCFSIADNYRGGHDLEITEVLGNIYENPELLD